MSFAVKTILKPISTATNCCSISSQSLFTASKFRYPHPCLSIAYKPIKFQLSSKNAPPPSLFCLKSKEPLSRVSAQEDNNPVILEEKHEEFEGNLNWDAYENEATDGAVEGEGFVEPPKGAKVYVGNFPYDVDSEKLAMVFQQAGVVEMVEVIYNRVTGQSRGFGFVTMATEEEAEKAVEMFHRYDLHGRFLTVYIAAPKGSQPERAPRDFVPIHRIYVGNLPWSVDSEQLEQVFREHGKVVSAQVISDRESGRSRGFGFVVMSSESEMNDAIANLDGQSLDGRAIRVEVAEERPRRSSRF